MSTSINFSTHGSSESQQDFSYSSAYRNPVTDDTVIKPTNSLPKNDLMENSTKISVNCEKTESSNDTIKNNMDQSISEEDNSNATLKSEDDKEMADTQPISNESEETNGFHNTTNEKDSPNDESLNDDKDKKKDYKENNITEVVDERNLSDEKMDVDVKKEELHENTETVKESEDIKNIPVEPQDTEENKNLLKSITNSDDCLQMIREHLETLQEEYEIFISDKELKMENFTTLVEKIKILTYWKQEAYQSDSDKKSRTSKRSRKKRSFSIESEGSSPTVKQKVEKEKEPEPQKDFKDLKGLAVFAKWPFSGWYYPGIIEDVELNQLKDLQSVKVHFYDGLVREMKSINVLPANLIHPESVVCNLDDETEMTVITCDKEEDHVVTFTLNTKGKTDEVLQLNFDKVAIKASHMKLIKQKLDNVADPNDKNMHVVSLDNLISGRRLRGRASRASEENSSPTPTGEGDAKENEDESSTTNSAKRRRLSSRNNPKRKI